MAGKYGKLYAFLYEGLVIGGIISSMSLTIEEVEHIALLARLQLSEEEKKRYQQQLSSILEHVAQLQELDTSGVTPLTSVLSEKMVTREDKAEDSLLPEKLFQNAPKDVKNQFRVPPVLDGDESHE